MSSIQFMGYGPNVPAGSSTPPPIHWRARFENPRFGPRDWQDVLPGGRSFFPLVWVETARLSPKRVYTASVRIRHLRVCSRLFFVSSVSSASAFVTDASVTVTSNWSYYMPNCGHIFCLEVGVLLQGLLSPFWGDAFLSHHVNATWYGLFCIKAVDYIVYRACLCSVEVVYLRSRLLRLQDSLKSASYMRHRSRLICIHARVQPITHLVWYSSSDLKIPFVDPAPSNSRPSWRRRARWRFHFMAL